MASAATLARRFPTQLALVLKAHGISADAIAQEIWRMAEVTYAKAAHRGVVGMLNEFRFLDDCWRPPFGEDRVVLSQKLAETPCGPRRKRPISLDRALRGGGHLHVPVIFDSEGVIFAFACLIPMVRMNRPT